MFAEFIAVIISAAVLMALPLALLRWRKGKLEPPLALAILARVAGALTVILGGGHVLSIAGGLLIGKRPYNLHNVELLWIGGVLVFSGLSNLALSGGLRRGERWAWRASGVVTIFVWLFTLSLIPVTDSSMNRALFFIHTVYLLYWAPHRPQPAIAQQNLPTALETDTGK